MRAVFLDRDGTIVEERGYITSPERISLIPGAAEGIAALRKAGWKAIMVSNQAGVAKGLMTEEDLVRVNARVDALLASEGTALDGLYCCPHHPEGTVPRYTQVCDCRKPGTGLLRRAAIEHGIDLASSVFVGDSIRDIEAGRGVGARTVLVLTGFGVKTRDAGGKADHVAADLAEAAAWILSGNLAIQ